MPDTARNREELQRKFCDPIAAEMRAGTFTPERYLHYFPYGTRAVEFRVPAFSDESDAPTVTAYYRDWIARQRPPLVRPAQQRDYRQHFDRYLTQAPWDTTRVFGDLTLAELRPRVWFHLRDYLLSLNLKPKTVKNILGSLRALVLDVMERTDYVQGNPFAQLRWQRALPAEPDPFDADERDRIISWFQTRKPHYYPFVLTLFLTGMRPSEAAGLHWGDVDLARGAIKVRRSRYQGAENAPKTRGSERTIYLLPLVRKTLQETMPLHAQLDDYVFLNEITGGPLNQGEWAREFWHRPLRALNIRPRKFYATRHTFISIALTAGVNLKWLAEQCGNSVAMIEQHYGRFLAGEVEAQLRLLERAAEPVATVDEGKRKAKLRTLKGRFAVSPEKALQEKVVPTGIEPVLPT